MFCAECGETLTEEMLFCPECGTPCAWGETGGAAPARSAGEAPQAGHAPTPPLVDGETARGTLYTSVPVPPYGGSASQQYPGGGYGGPAQNGSYTTPPGAGGYAPPGKTGGKKSRARILIPILIIAALIIVLIVLWTTGVVSFGNTGGNDLPAATASENFEDNAVISTPVTPPVTIPATTPSTPSPSAAPSWIPPQSPPPGMDGLIPGSGGEAQVSSSSKFAFTPDKPGPWQIRTYDNGDSDPSLALYDPKGNVVAENDDGATDGNSFICLKLEAGTTYTINAGFYENGSGSYTLSISPAGTIRSGGGDVTVSAQMGFMFTPDRSGLWEFYTSNNGETDPYLVIFDPDYSYISYSDDTGGDMNAYCTAYLDAGSTYSINAGSYDIAGSYTLTVSPAAELPGGGGEVQVSSQAGFAFTPDRSGTWQFYTSSDGSSDPYLEIYDSNGTEIDSDDDGGGGNDAFLAIYLQEGSQYSINVGFYDIGIAGCKLTVSLSAADTASSVATDLAENGGSIRVDDTIEFAYTPDRSGMWVLSTSDNENCDPYLRISDVNGTLIDEDDDSMGDNNALLLVYLDAGATYNVSAGFWGSGGSYVLTVLPADELSGGGGKVNIDAAKAFEFTPDQSAIWAFHTSGSGSGEPYLGIYDKDGNLIGSSDDSSGGPDVVITAKLDAGETYGIMAGFYNGSEGSYTLTITGI